MQVFEKLDKLQAGSWDSICSGTKGLEPQGGGRPIDAGISARVIRAAKNDYRVLVWGGSSGDPMIGGAVSEGGLEEA